MIVTININEPQIIKKVTNDKFGRFLANEWKKLINPFTPRRTSQLIGITGATVRIKPFEIHYDTEYSGHVYFSNNWNFYKELSPFATDHWDQKAANAGQLDKLYTAANNALRNGNY